MFWPATPLWFADPLPRTPGLVAFANPSTPGPELLKPWTPGPETPRPTTPGSPALLDPATPGPFSQTPSIAGRDDTCDSNPDSSLRYWGCKGHHENGNQHSHKYELPPFREWIFSHGHGEIFGLLYNRPSGPDVKKSIAKPEIEGTLLDLPGGSSCLFQQLLKES